jgi:D-amino-acid oxidase
MSTNQDLIVSLSQFRRLASTELPDGIKSGVEYETVAVNPAKYLPWLKEKLLAKGVTFIRRKIQRLDDLYEYTGHDGIAVNCTALGSRSILGIEDPHLYPIRGQTVTVNAPEIKGCHAVVSRKPSVLSPWYWLILRFR